MSAARERKSNNVMNIRRFPTILACAIGLTVSSCASRSIYKYHSEYHDNSITDAKKHKLLLCEIEDDYKKSFQRSDELGFLTCISDKVMLAVRGGAIYIGQSWSEIQYIFGNQIYDIDDSGLTKAIPLDYTINDSASINGAGSIVSPGKQWWLVIILEDSGRIHEIRMQYETFAQFYRDARLR